MIASSPRSARKNFSSVAIWFVQSGTAHAASPSALDRGLPPLGSIRFYDCALVDLRSTLRYSHDPSGMHRIWEMTSHELLERLPASLPFACATCPAYPACTIQHHQRASSRNSYVLQQTVALLLPTSWNVYAFRTSTLVVAVYFRPVSACIT
eukprot:6087170-Pleurochrysis_carterae.AAC.2